MLYQHDLLCTVYLYIESDGTLLKTRMCSDVMFLLLFSMTKNITHIKENSLSHLVLDLMEQLNCTCMGT